LISASSCALRFPSPPAAPGRAALPAGVSFRGEYLNRYHYQTPPHAPTPASPQNPPGFSGTDNQSVVIQSRAAPAAVSPRSPRTAPACNPVHQLQNPITPALRRQMALFAQLGSPPISLHQVSRNPWDGVRLNRMRSKTVNFMHRSALHKPGFAVWIGIPACRNLYNLSQQGDHPHPRSNQLPAFRDISGIVRLRSSPGCRARCKRCIWLIPA